MRYDQTGSKIKNLRIQAGFSQEELAKKSQLSLRTIQRIENGETVPRGDSLQKISTVLDFPISGLTDYILKDDKVTLMLINISALGYLISPLLGVILPLILWLAYKDKITRINENGIKIIKSQVYWLSVFLIIYIYIFISKFFHLNLPLPIEPKLAFIGLYLYNFFVIIINIVQCYFGKQENYKPNAAF